MYQCLLDIYVVVYLLLQMVTKTCNIISCLIYIDIFSYMIVWFFIYYCTNVYETLLQKCKTCLKKNIYIKKQHKNNFGSNFNLPVTQVWSLDKTLKNTRTELGQFSHNENFPPWQPIDLQ